MARKTKKKTLSKKTKKKILSKKPKKQRVKKWFLVYEGLHKHINLPGIGRIIPGKEYPIDEQRANQFKEVDPKLGWKVMGRISYE